MSKIKYLCMDVDGTLTDGNIYISNHGELFKSFSIKDGYGIKNIAIKNGIIPVIITGRESQITENRCKELDIEIIFQGVSNKLDILNELTSDLSTVAYIGDDLNDLSCMKKVNEKKGITGCPQDACKEIKLQSMFISQYKGGNGAVREFIEWIINLSQC